MDTKNNRPGVLVQFFYGWSGQPQDRYVNAIELMQGYKRSINFEKGSLKENVELCRRQNVPGWRFWWARTLAFDALIGNTDRHLENWGFIVRRAPDGKVRYLLAPPFDNGTSLGFIQREAGLNKFRDSKQVDSFIANGRHHYSWADFENERAGHIALCRTFAERYADTGLAMRSVIQLSDAQIDDIVTWCMKFSFVVPFTKDRAYFVATQLRQRRDALAIALGQIR
jgi:hypothetical protein